MKKKKLPDFVQGRLAIAFFQSRVGRILTNWALQGMLYMNPIETLFKIALDIVLCISVWLLFVNTGSVAGWIVAWAIAHTLNWIINGQPVALLFHLGWGECDAQKFIVYVEKMKKRFQKVPYISGVASFGSISRGSYNSRSDIDIRIVMKDGWHNGIRAANFCFLERLRAAVSFFPLDLYAFEINELQGKMRSDEIPVVFVDQSGLIEKTYPVRLSFQEFIENFKKSHIGNVLS